MGTNGVCDRCGKSIEETRGGCQICQLQLGFGLSPSETTAAQNVASSFDAADLAGKFENLEVLELLGAGGMGAVYSARQKKLDRIVALKVVRPDISDSDSEEFAQRFEREAKALARLNHPNIVSIYDFGQVDGIFYYIMEYVDGTDLGELAHAESLSPAESLEIVSQVCQAIQYAHENGVVHRDIKPTNILLNAAGLVKIADFGLAKLCAANDQSTQLTQTRQVFGTPRYMAPEQVEATREVDHRADIYSLGVVFYELLTGELPMGRFDPPSKKIEVDVRLDEVVLRALEKHPERRYQAARELYTDISQLTNGQPSPPIKSGMPKRSVPAYVPLLLIPGLLCIVLSLFGFVQALNMEATTMMREHLASAILGFWGGIFGVVMTFAGVMLWRWRSPKTNDDSTKDLSPVEKLFTYRNVAFGLVFAIFCCVGLPWIEVESDVTRSFTGGQLTSFSLTISVLAVCFVALVFINIYEGAGVYFHWAILVSSLAILANLMPFLIRNLQTSALLDHKYLHELQTYSGSCEVSYGLFFALFLTGGLLLLGAYGVSKSKGITTG